VPSPAAGLFVASLPLILFYNYFNIDALLVNKWVLYAITILVSYLMVCNARFIALKFKKGSDNQRTTKIVLVVSAVVAAIFLKWLAIPVVFIVYIILSLITKRQTR
jgi:CDP-diacylglycerol--serine O-phosphatidyltransferase